MVSCGNTQDKSKNTKGNQHLSTSSETSTTDEHEHEHEDEDDYEEDYDDERMFSGVVSTSGYDDTETEDDEEVFTSTGANESNEKDTGE